jgi:hypothetical protein
MDWDTAYERLLAGEIPPFDSDIVEGDENGDADAGR